MTEATAYALGAMLCYGLADFIYKRAATAGIRADHFLMGQAWSFLPLVLAYAAATGTLVPRPSALWGALAGLFAFVGLYNFARSLVGGAVGINAAIFRLNFIVTAFLAIAVLGEPLTWPKLGGLALALVAAAALLGAGQSGAGRAGDRRALAQVLLATLAFGVANLCHTFGLRLGALPETLLVAQAAVFMPLATLFAFLRDRRFRPPARAAWRFGATTAAVLLGAFVFLLTSISLGQASIMVPIGQMGFVVTALLGIIFLGEAVTPRKLLGLAAALAALGVLAAS